MRPVYQSCVTVYTAAIDSRLINIKAAQFTPKAEEKSCIASNSVEICEGCALASLDRRLNEAAAAEGVMPFA